MPKKQIVLGDKEAAIIDEFAHVANNDTLAFLCGLTKRELMRAVHVQPDFVRLIARRRSEARVKIVSFMLKQLYSGSLSKKQMIQVTKLIWPFGPEETATDANPVIEEPDTSLRCVH